MINKELQALKEELRIKDEELSLRRSRLVELELELTEKGQECATTLVALRDIEERLSDLTIILQESQSLLRKKDAEVSLFEAAIQSRNEHIQNILISTSWRITRPIRWLGNRARKLFRRYPRTASLLRSLKGLLPMRSSRSKQFSITLPNLPTSNNQLVLDLTKGSEKHDFCALAERQAYVLDHDSFVDKLESMVINPDPQIFESSLVHRDRSVNQFKLEYLSWSESRLQGFLESKRRIVLAEFLKPSVSIIVATYKQTALLLTCIESLMTGSGVTWELILIDNDASPDVQVILERIDGVRIIRNPSNRGLVEPVNQAAQIARGRYILMLNDDAALLPSTLANAIYAIEKEESVGAVGGKILYPGGVLQEAGSMIWKDGSCSGYGRLEDANAGEYNFRRSVDYCSGAFLLIRKELFDSLGGLDINFAPAYYEETDFCLRLNQAGHRVVFDPNVIVVHFEFASAGASTAIEMQKRNKKTFFHKHHYALGSQFSPDPANIILGRSRDHCEGRILIIDDRVPHPFLGSGYPRAKCLVEAVCECGYSVTFYPLHFPEDDWHLVRKTLPDSVEVILNRGKQHLESFLAGRKGYYDIILISRPHNMLFFQSILDKCPDIASGTKIVYDAEAVFSLRDQIQASALGKPLDSDQAEAAIVAEISLAKSVDLIITVSPREAEVFYKRNYRKLTILSHPVSTEISSNTFEKRANFLFVGPLYSDDTPNSWGLRWFVETVWPQIVERLGKNVFLLVAGKADGPWVQEIRAYGVNFLGAIPDLSNLYSNSKVFVSPAFFSGGIPLKILEAAGNGLPVVASPLLAEQLGWLHGRELLVANAPEDFASCCVELYTNPGLWEKVRRSAAENVSANFSQKQFLKTVQDILEKPT